MMEREGRDADWSWREAIPQVRGNPGPLSPCEAPPGDAQLGAPWPRGQCPGEGLSGQVWGEWRRQPRRLGRQMLKGLGHTARLVDRATQRVDHQLRTPAGLPRLSLDPGGPQTRKLHSLGLHFLPARLGRGDAGVTKKDQEM